MSTKKDKFSNKDKFYMKVALDLAKSRHGLTGTNPSVGSVIVKNDQIISVGVTSYNGRPHAEYNAIKDCLEDLDGAKIYITLEPCCHQGLTPPCTDLIIKSKITKVIYSINDIDQRVSKKSFNILKNHNIHVMKGLLKNEIQNFYNPYFLNKKKKLPFVTGKIAISKNDLIYSKIDKKITNVQSDKFSHILRLRNDCLMISHKTLNKDNPKLNCRIKGFEKFSPKRVILDNKLNSNIKSYIIRTANRDNTIIFYNKATKSKILEFKRKGIKLVKSKINKKNRFDIKILLKKLYQQGCRNLLIESGESLTNSLLKNKIFDKFYLFKGSKNHSKYSEYLKFNSLDVLNKKYKKKINLNLDLRGDKITLYKN